MNYPTLGRAPDPFSDLEQARQLFAQARELVAAAQAERVAAEAIRGQALWCDQGGHAFSPRDRGRQQWTVKVFDDDSGVPIEETRQACADHGPELGQRRTHPGGRDRAQVQAQLAAHPVADPQYTAYLEWQCEQPIETDTSLPAYVRWQDRQRQLDAEAGK